jgi:DNA-binding MarR family transcriptional regulator
MKKSYTPYEEAQIVLAAIRLFQHREKRPPRMKELAEFSCLSLETVHHLCNRLEKVGAIDRIRSAFEDGIVLKESLRAEELREETGSPDIKDDIDKVRVEQERKVQEVEKRFSKDLLEKEKQDIFSGIEERLKRGGREEKESPLDALFGKKLK